MQYIGSQTPSGAATVTFSSPPAFPFYLFYITARTSTAGSDQIFMVVNGAGGTAYNDNTCLSTSSAMTTGQSSGLVGFATGSDTANCYGGTMLLLGGVNQTTLSPTWVSTSADYDSGTDIIDGTMGGIYTTAPASITSLAFKLSSGGNFQAGSRLTMYGLV